MKLCLNYCKNCSHFEKHSMNEAVSFPWKSARVYGSIKHTGGGVKHMIGLYFWYYLERTRKLLLCSRIAFSCEISCKVNARKMFALSYSSKQLKIQCISFFKFHSISQNTEIPCSFFRSWLTDKRFKLHLFANLNKFRRNRIAFKIFQRFAGYSNWFTWTVLFIKLWKRAVCLLVANFWRWDTCPIISTPYLSFFAVAASTSFSTIADMVTKLLRSLGSFQIFGTQAFVGKIRTIDHSITNLASSNGSLVI